LKPEFTYDDLLAELDALVRAETYPPREPGDIDSNDIAARYGYKKNKADRVRDILGKSPGWTRVKVFDPATRRVKWVIRKEA
jgi:hypothetical protein